MLLHFGPHELDPERYELRSDGEKVDVEPRVLEVLAHLAANPGRVVSREELVDEVWEGKHVTDAAVTKAVGEARRALGDTARESRWIRTVYGRGFAFTGEIHGNDERHPDPPDRASPSPPRPLPTPLASLVGREEELAAVEELLGESRLLTLTGAAGTGKTRLALEVAHRTKDRFPDGQAFVPLSELDDPGRVARAALLALGEKRIGGVDPGERLIQRLGDRRILLVLDNFEHLMPAAPLLARLLRSCPETTLLVTSRFVLRLEGEQEYGVPPLAVEGEASPEARPAVALFLERARAADPDFRPGEEKLHRVAEICRRLDGLPLAIELAAPWVKVLSPREILERLAERPNLLASPGADRPDRHRSLEEALSWSHELLSDEERMLFRRLAVFPGSFDLPAAEEVAAAPEELDVLRLLGSLVDKSLLVTRTSRTGGRRFGFLETTHRFARERLREASEEAPVRSHHARWVLDLALRAEPEIAAGNQEIWLSRLDELEADIFAAIDWCSDGGDLVTGLTLAAAVARYWSARGAYGQGVDVLATLLDRPGSEEATANVRADALSAQGMLFHLLSDYESALPRLERSLELYRELGDREGIAESLNHLAWVAAQLSDLERAVDLAREALALHRELGDRRGEAVSLNNLGWSAMLRNRWDLAEDHWRRGLEIRRKLADERGIAFTLANLALSLYHSDGDRAEARAMLEEARTIVERLEDRPLLGWVLAAEGLWCLASDDAARAAELLERSERSMREVNQPDGVAWALLFQSDAHRALGHRKRAVACLRETLSIWRPRNHRWGVAQAEARLQEL